MIGTTINNRYRVDTQLGQGGMGTVYKGFDTSLQRAVAVKIMTKTGLGTEGRSRLLHEAQAIARLNHQNIVTVYDVGEANLSDLEGLTPFIVMECVEGDNLFEHPPATIDNILTVTRQVCAALEHAHENGIIHRDLKPENIVITANGRAKLMDFGMARSMASRLTTTGTIMGTVFYLAPEQALGQEVDQRSDLYALGVMLYELTTGELPFTADDPLAVISQHVHAPVVPPRAKNETIPGYLNDLILQLLRKDPADRPVSARAVLDLLKSPAISRDEIAPPEELSVLDRIVRGRLVGREIELHQARQGWQQAAAGNGQLLLISGEPGVGKSRLMREVVTLAEVGGGQAFVGESQAEGNAPYAAFAQIVRRALRAHSNNGLEITDLVLAELIAIAPEIQFDFPDVAPNPPLEPDSERRRLFESVIRFVTHLSAKNPLLLVFEDIHWADSGTLSLLQFLAQRTRELPVMLLGTYREVELDEALPFHETLLDLNRRNLGARLKLERLDQEKTRALLAVIFSDEITPEFLAGIYTETEGNPFFVEEVCKALLESGDVYFANGEWHRPEMAEMTIPQSIKVAVQSRLSKLDQTTQEILLNAAVFGREFDYETLLQVTGKDEDALIDGLEAALKAQLIEELTEGDGERFWFSHALIPASLRDSLSGLRRTRLHRKIAQVMEVVHSEAFQRLAYHWGEGGHDEKGLAYTIKAADRAKETFANKDAIRLYTEALDLIPENHETRFDLLASRAAVYDVTAQRDAQITDFELMLNMAEKQGNDARLVDTLIAQTMLYLEIEIPKAREPADRAIEIAKELGDFQRYARATANLGWQRGYSGDNNLARTLMESAITKARKGGFNNDLAEYLSRMVVMLVTQGNHEQLLPLAEEAVELSKSVGNRRLETMVTRRLAGAYWTMNEYTQALPFAESALQIARDIGDVDNETGGLNVLGLIKRDMGLLNEAEALFLEILQTPDLFDTLSPGHAISNLTVLYTRAGDYEKNLLLSADILERAHKENNQFWIAQFQLSLRRYYYFYGMYNDAFDLLEEAYLYFKKTKEKHIQADLLGVLVYYAIKIGNSDLADQSLNEAQKICDGLGDLSTKANVLLNSAYGALLDDRPKSIKAGLERCNQGINILQDISARIEWESYYTLSGLHLALLDEDPFHADEALSNIEKALNKFPDSWQLWLPPEFLEFMQN